MPSSATSTLDERVVGVPITRTTPSPDKDGKFE